MKKQAPKSKVDWKWWWEQVLNGTIPESTYYIARLQEKHNKEVNELKETISGLREKVNGLS